MDASGDQFESCHLSPIRRNSVLEELRDKRLEVIQEVICVRAPGGAKCLPESLRDERREKVVCYGDQLFTDKPSNSVTFRFP